MIIAAPRSEKQMTYADAVLYCAFCDHDGYSDWRLPTLDEYRQLYMVAGWWLSENPFFKLGYAYPVRNI